MSIASNRIVGAQRLDVREGRRPACTDLSCPTFVVTTYLDQLRQALPCVPPVPVDGLKSLHAARDFQGMVTLVKTMMNIDCKLGVAWVNSGGPKDMAQAPAWIQMPASMPFYGTAAFRTVTITMFIRKSFLESRTYDQVAIAFAHELSHVVLESIQHPLRACEKAVDLTAMLLGFRRLYKSACYRERRTRTSISYENLGYLSPMEVQLADHALRD